MWFLLAGALASADPAPDLAGTWRLAYAVVTRNDLPVVGSLQSTSRSTAIVRVGADRIAHHELCASSVEGGIVKSRLPAAYVATMPRRSYPLELVEEAGALRFRADTGFVHVGYTPSCPDLPLAPDDPCVADTDADGRPGATIQARAPMFPWVDVYVAQRNHLVLEGVVVGADRIEGEARMASMENHVLGASNRLFARSPTAELVPGASRFELTRLAPDATCVDALAASPAP